MKKILHREFVIWLLSSTMIPSTVIPPIFLSFLTCFLVLTCSFPDMFLSPVPFFEEVGEICHAIPKTQHGAKLGRLVACYG